MSVNLLNTPFSEKTNPELPDLSARPTVEPVPTMNPNVKVGWNADKTEYAVPITEENIVILLLLTVPQDAIQMTANLKAPIIINADTRKGAQVVVENEEYEIKYRIYDILKGKKEA